MAPLWLLRMARRARRPPSARMVATVFAVVGVCLALVLVERLLGWPDWATVERFGARGIAR